MLKNKIKRKSKPGEERKPNSEKRENKVNPEHGEVKTKLREGKKAEPGE